SDRERYEARGLIGRIFKQRYMNAPDADGAPALLRRAVEAYETAYEEKKDKNFWHGVNAASCMLRAERDGIPVAPPGRAQEIARQVLAGLYELERGGPLDVWDCASKVEALLALERYDEAERALDRYINHPGMRPFEVSSTCRQFDQVLQLEREPRGRPILARLREAMERYRAGRAVSRPPGQAARSDSNAPRTKPLVIRLGEPDWEPKGVADLVIQSRLGKIVTARGSDASVRELLADSTVISVEESRPAGRIECARSLPFINAATQSKPNPAVTYTERGDRALIAVIDDGIDVLHEAFLDAEGKSRIVGIWNQNSSDGGPPEGFSYGAFHDAQAVAGYVASGLVPPSLGRDPAGHGTHVASIAAGRAAGNFAGGVAPDARLLVVVSGAGGPRGYDMSNNDALVFIDRFAAKLAMPVVVNVSHGKNAGAHDGKSAIEGSFDAFSQSGTKAGRVIVKSAGNERDKYGHAYVTLGPDGLERLRWRRQPGAGITERIELWWSSDHELEFRLGEPVKSVDPPLKPAAPADWSKWVNTAAPVCDDVFQNGGPYRLAFTKHHNDNGDSLLEIVLGSDTASAGYGDWLLEIRSGNLLTLCEIHCWIERSQGLPTVFKSHADENMTLTIPGTAQSVITVGAVDACRPLVVGDSSSYGPTRIKHSQPLVCAPGVDVNAARAGTSNDVIPKDGTSMAAPHVTGAVALLLSKAAKEGKAFGANQIAAVLRQKAQNYNGGWDRGRGYGVIDVAALLAALV
ncbi:MAG: S8 family serine peptidase, partial [Acidobacteriota bacterium]|nr:S8 family serine peptidase [Acidobacteriota bacterium]